MGAQVHCATLPLTKKDRYAWPYRVSAAMQVLIVLNISK